MDSNSATTAREPRIIVVGGGFGGLAAARALRKASARVDLIDKTNHHVFQPLLYQVATSVLSPEHIGAPIRHVLRRQANTTVVQGTVTGVDVGKKLTVMLFGGVGTGTHPGKRTPTGSAANCRGSGAG